MVSLGYLEQKDNKKNFKKIDGKLWYKTGDIVTKINNYFIIKGRVDRIVKIKGYRVDLTEVEKYLKDHNDIDNAVCFLKKDILSDDKGKNISSGNACGIKFVFSGYLSFSIVYVICE